MRKAAGRETPTPTITRVFVSRPTTCHVRKPGDPLEPVPGVAGEITPSAHVSRKHHDMPTVWHIRSYRKNQDYQRLDDVDFSNINYGLIDKDR